MNIGTVIEFLMGFGFIPVGIISKDGNILSFLNWESLLIVLGGTFAATLITYPTSNVSILFNDKFI